MKLEFRRTLTGCCLAQKASCDRLATCTIVTRGVLHDDDFAGEWSTFTYAFATLTSSIHKMSSPIARESGESFASPVPSSPASQFPFPNSDPSRNIPQRGSVRRQSTTSSIASIGSVIDTARGQSTIAESGQNGWHIPCCALSGR